MPRDKVPGLDVTTRRLHTGLYAVVVVYPDGVQHVPRAYTCLWEARSMASRVLSALIRMPHASREAMMDTTLHLVRRGNMTLEEV